MDRIQMIDDLNRKLHEWDARLDARIESLDATKDVAAAELKLKRAQLMEERAKLEVRLAKARESAGDGWERTSRELGKAWDEFKKTAERVAGSFSD